MTWALAAMTGGTPLSPVSSCSCATSVGCGLRVCSLDAEVEGLDRNEVNVDDGGAVVVLSVFGVGTAACESGFMSFAFGTPVSSLAGSEATGTTDTDAATDAATVRSCSCPATGGTERLFLLLLS